MMLNGSQKERVVNGEKTLTECGGCEHQMVFHTPHPDVDGELGWGMIGGHGD